MSKKTKKALLITLLCLVLSLGITYIVLYCIYPTKTQTITWDVVDYICNKPLPVVGVTTLVLVYFIFKLVRYIVQHKSIKAIELKTQIDQAKDEIEQYKSYIKDIEDKLEQYKEENKVMYKDLCYAIPNKKVKELGDKVYGKRDDSKQETKEI